MTDFRMGSRMCDYCQRNLPSGDLCGCEGEKEARFRWMDRLIREDVGDLPPVGSQRERQLAAVLAIAIDDHDSSVGCSMKEAHWTNKARALLATPATTVDETERLAVMQDLATLPDDLASLVAAHIREMYPDVAKAAPSTFMLSVRNTIRNKAHGVVMPVLAALSDRPQAEGEVNRG